jgi:hypothetical protein
MKKRNLRQELRDLQRAVMALKVKGKAGKSDVTTKKQNRSPE